jgi:hypothetical protein
MLLYLTVSTLVLALVLFANNYHKNKHAVCVLLFLLTVSLYGVTHYFVLFGESPFWLAVFYNNFTPLYLIFGPLLFFYVRGVVQDTECISKKDLLHGIPALIQLIGIMPYLFSPFELKLDYANQILTHFDTIITLDFNLFYNASVSFLIRVSLFLIYILYSAFFLWKNSSLLKAQKVVPTKQFIISMRWLVTLLSSVFVITVYLLALTLLSFALSPKEAFSSIYWLHLISGIAYFIMTFSLLVFSEIFYGMPRSSERKNTIPSEISFYEKSYPELFQKQDNPLFPLGVVMITVLETEKPFLNPDFSADNLAVLLQEPQHKISYCINTLLKTSFYQLRSKLRVEHVIQLLKKEAHTNLTVEAVAMQSGFKSRSTFYTSFKEYTQKSPAEFLNTLTD